MSNKNPDPDTTLIIFFKSGNHDHLRMKKSEALEYIGAWKKGSEFATCPGKSSTYLSSQIEGMSMVPVTEEEQQCMEVQRLSVTSKLKQLKEEAGEYDNG